MRAVISIRTSDYQCLWSAIELVPYLSVNVEVGHGAPHTVRRAILHADVLVLVELAADIVMGSGEHVA